MLAEYAAELYVHAIAIEREAARRYAELAERMARQGDQAAAALFRTLAALDARRLDELERGTRGVDLPMLTSDHSWRGAGPAQSPGHCLAVALRAERCARAFFEHAGRTADDPAARALAKEMAAQEAEHIALITRLLQQ